MTLADFTEPNLLVPESLHESQESAMADLNMGRDLPPGLPPIESPHTQFADDGGNSALLYVTTFFRLGLCAQLSY
jgi:hypothetical protein